MLLLSMAGHVPCGIAAKPMDYNDGEVPNLIYKEFSSHHRCDPLLRPTPSPSLYGGELEPPFPTVIRRAEQNRKTNN